ncbi:acireductone synthase [Hydrogenivirga sp. 128-5-R1-1]|uniref:acireductone synthase n=1 Tax=Hydrogenivirga sp. 128-5-R1-1 TaxID=392423 RepID=UPI00015F3722|nr:acireductone synthase [Hydrogenivirga sp. 128-5-R1-1]EDP76400.1 enolase-phosphatase E-1 [Hydrogenivirga sp. 128-5-R1-1]
MIKAILTDIEGTTSSISFVKDVLFPYSKRKLREFVQKHSEDPQVQRILREVREIEPGDPVETLLRWIDEDRKVTPLKELQGLIWEEGYKSGELKGHIYEDAYRRLKEWYEKGIPIYVYSSGSVKAQRLLFGHTQYGDLNYLFSGHFDTKIGNKKESESYRKIAEEIGLEPEEILFLSDSPEEIKASAEAGMKVIRFAREGENEFIEDFPYPQVRSFEEVTLD